MKNTFTGTGVALITPFQNDFSIDTNDLRAVVEHVITNGVDYLVVLGTTSEGATLNQIEKEAVLKTVIETNQNRLPIVLGLGGNNTFEVISQIKKQSFKHISGILSVVPYYTKPTQDGMFAHFSAIAEASPLPIILYNVPSRTGVNMKAETTLKLAEKYSNIVAIKEASGDMMQIMEILKNKPAHFELISGDDALTMPLIALGAIGVISVAANAISRPFSDMVRFQLENQTSNARELHFKMLKMIELLFVDGNPAGVKTLMNEIGLCKETVRLPLVAVSEKTRHLIQKEWSNIINYK